MKTPLVPLLLLSLAGNAALALLYWRAPDAPVPVPSYSVPASSGALTEVKTEAGEDSAGRPAVTEQGTAAVPVVWSGLQANGDLRGCVARLRLAGFPPATIRAIVKQLLNERFADRHAAIEPPFWKRGSRSPEQTATQQVLYDEEQQLFESLLGDDARPSAVMVAGYRKARYGDLADAKVDAIAMIERDYAAVHRAASAEGQANMLGDMEARRKQQEIMEQELHADLAAVLTPEELEQYEMRNSVSASRMISGLRAIDVTEAEYGALFHLQQASDAANPASTRATPEGAARYQTAQQTLNEQVRTVLTDDRFYKYLETSDIGYAQLAKSLQAFPSVTPEATYEVSKIQREMQTAMTGMSRDKSLTMQQRTEQMRSLIAPYESRIDALLGPEAAATYKKQGAGRIFTSIRSATPGG